MLDSVLYYWPVNCLEACVWFGHAWFVAVSRCVLVAMVTTWQHALVNLFSFALVVFYESFLIRDSLRDV